MSAAQNIGATEKVKVPVVSGGRREIGIKQQSDFPDIQTLLNLPTVD